MQDITLVCCVYVCACSALNSSDIKILGVDLLPGYYDPFSGRTLTKGEVGCFLSHFYIWKEVRSHLCVPIYSSICHGAFRTVSPITSQPSSQMVDVQMDKALVFEDDVRFQANFKRRVLRLMEEVEQAELDWDIM